MRGGSGEALLRDNVIFFGRRRVWRFEEMFRVSGFRGFGVKLSVQRWGLACGLGTGFEIWVSSFGSRAEVWDVGERSLIFSKIYCSHSVGINYFDNIQLEWFKSPNRTLYQRHVL